MHSITNESVRGGDAKKKFFPSLPITAFVWYTPDCNNLFMVFPKCLLNPKDSDHFKSFFFG